MKCLSNETLAILLDEIQTNDKLQFIEERVEIMDREVKRLKRSCALIVKVQWNLRRGPEFTWECEDQLQKKYLHLFANPVYASNATDSQLTGPEIIHEKTEKIVQIKSRIQAACDRQKSYVDIIAKVRTVAYRFEFPEQLSQVYKRVEIMDREVKRLKRSCVLIVKVQWNLRRGPEFTWECEDQLQKKYLHLFANPVYASNATS
nr:hypothetical protein [Tanacetum cinerariifolium]